MSTHGRTPDYFFHLEEDFFFRPLRASDLDGRWPDWFNDPEVTTFQAKGYFPNSRETQKNYFERVTGSHTDVVLAIIERSTDTHIGNVGLHDIAEIHGTAVLGIVIGEKSAWGRGIGARSWAAITRYGFQVLNLHKITATVLDGNDRSLKCALSAGYMVEGKQAKQLFKNGRYIDLIHVGLLKEDWKG